MTKRIALLLLAGLLVGTLVSFAGRSFWPVCMALIMSFATLWWSRHIHRTLLSPVSLLAVAWLLAPLSTYMDSKWALIDETWIIIFGSYIAFFAGYLLHIFAWNRRLYVLRVSPNVRANIWSRRIFERMFIFIFSLGMLGFTINLTNVLRHGGLGLYWQHGFRDAEYIFAFHPLTNYLYFLNMLVVILGLVYLRRYGLKATVGVGTAISFGALFFHGVRSTVLLCAVIAAFALYLMKQRVRLRQVVVVGMIAFLSFAIVTVGRLDTRPTDVQPGSVLTETIDQMFLYLAPNFANLQMELLNRQDKLGGWVTLEPILRLISLRSRVKFLLWEPPHFDLFLVDEVYLAGTYARDFYMDFGSAGVIVASFILGFTTTAFFIGFLRTRTTRSLVIYAVMATMITFTFFRNYFLEIQFWYFITVVWLIDIMVKRAEEARVKRGILTESRIATLAPPE